MTDQAAAELQRQIQEQLARIEAQHAAERQLAEQLRQQQGGPQ
ncbi:hypothetical protein ACIOJE_27305 [Kitasatospora sp. NPDC087861]